MTAKNIISRVSVACVAALVLFSSCTRDISGPEDVLSGEQVQITALPPAAFAQSFASDESAKSHLDGVSVKWNKGDRISAFYSESEYATSANLAEDDAPGMFLFDKNPYTYAFYPGADVIGGVSLSGNTLTLPGGFPHEQSAVENGFDPAANLTVASCGSSPWQFYNAGALLALQLLHIQNGVLPLKQIRIINDGTPSPLSGKVAVTINGASTSTVPAGTVGTDCYNDVILKPSAGHQTIDIPSGISVESAPVYYLVVAPGTFGGVEGGLKIELTRSDDKTGVFKTSAPLVLERNGNVLLAQLQVDDIKFVPAPTQIILNKTDISLAVGETFDLVVDSVVPADARKDVSWSSDRTDIATVDENGCVMAVSEGIACITAVSKADNDVTATCNVIVGGYAARIGEKLYATLGAARNKVTEGQTIVLLKDNTEVTGGDYPYGLNYSNTCSFTIDLNGFSIIGAHFLQSSAYTITLKNGSVTSLIYGMPYGGAYQSYCGPLNFENVSMPDGTSTKPGGTIYCGYHPVHISGGCEVGTVFRYGYTPSVEISGENTRIGALGLQDGATPSPVTISGGWFKQAYTSGENGVTIVGGKILPVSYTPYPGYGFKFVPYGAIWDASAYSDMTARTQYVYAKDGDTSAYFRVVEGNKRVHYQEYSKEGGKFYCEFSTTGNNQICFTVPGVTVPAGSQVKFCINGLRGVDGFVFNQPASLSCGSSSDSDIEEFTMPRTSTDFEHTFTITEALNNQDLLLYLNHTHGPRDEEGKYRYCIFSSVSVSFE